MIWGFLYGNFDFSESDKANALLELLINSSEQFRPAFYGTAEPIELKLSPDDLSEPARLLSGGNSGGSVYLRTANNNGTFVFSWVAGEIAQWRFFLEDKLFETEEQTAAFVDLITQLVENYEIMYGSIGPRKDWKKEHWISSQNSSRKVGLDLNNCLPVITWLAVLNRSLIDSLGANEKLADLSIHQQLNVNKDVVLVLRPNPLSGAGADRRKHSREIMEAIGSDYFFNIASPGKICQPIEGLTRSGKDNETDWLPDPEQDGRFAAFRDQEIRTEDGQKFDRPGSLAEMLIVYLHEELPPILNYSEDVLKALNEYLQRVPQQENYSYVHLFQQFGPALGAYIGELLVRLYQGEWQSRQPLMHSMVLINDQPIDVFAIAYNILFKDMALLDQLNRLVALNLPD